MGSSFNLWHNRLTTQDTLTRGQIRQFCNAIAAGSYGFEIGGNKTNLTPNECAILMDVFNARTSGYKLTPEHTRFGIEWLRKDPNRALSLGITQPMLDTFQGFRFVDVRIEDVGTWASRAIILPEYRVLSPHGNVDYSWSPWTQSAYA
jgi:hypothetical protein